LERQERVAEWVPVRERECESVCQSEREREREKADQILGARQAIHIHKSQAYRPLSNKQRVREDS
jgi:hypothetical protein